jgi:hypothetical protein
MRRRLAILSKTLRIPARFFTPAAAFLLLLAFTLTSAHGLFCADACNRSSAESSDNNDTACVCLCHGTDLLIERPRVVSPPPAPQKPLAPEQTRVLPGVFPPIDHPPEA